MIPPKVAALTGLLGAFAALPICAETITFQTTAFSQGFSIVLPASFQPGYENLSDGYYILELVPQGERVEDWTELFTLTALEGQTGNAADYADSIYGTFADACPDTFAHAELELPNISGAAAAVAGYVACGDLGGYSEAMVFVTMDGAADAYSLQLAERSMPSQIPISYEPGYWAARVSLLAEAVFTAP